MIGTDHDTISVVITTFERPDACERALLSVLDQTTEPLEILICDDGSSDETRTRFSEWERRNERVRYFRMPENTRTPGATRNLGVSHARGAWVAFLDDDDRWLPHKLTRQREAIAAGNVDVIATNALRNDETPYFPEASPTMRPTRRQLVRANPIITSSAIVRRPLARFPTHTWMRGIEDYAAWLELADGGARFLILGEPLVAYEDEADNRLSVGRTLRELAVARLAWQRAMRRPIEPSSAGVAIRRTGGALYVAASDLLAGVRSHNHPAVSSRS